MSVTNVCHSAVSKKALVPVVARCFFLYKKERKERKRKKGEERKEEKKRRESRKEKERPTKKIEVCIAISC